MASPQAIYTTGYLSDPTILHFVLWEPTRAASENTSGLSKYHRLPNSSVAYRKMMLGIQQPAKSEERAFRMFRSASSRQKCRNWSLRIRKTSSALTPYRSIHDVRNRILRTKSSSKQKNKTKERMANISYALFPDSATISLLFPSSARTGFNTEIPRQSGQSFGCSFHNIFTFE